MKNLKKERKRYAPLGHLAYRSSIDLQAWANMGLIGVMMATPVENDVPLFNL
jgi:hypothetical protein